MPFLIREIFEGRSEIAARCLLALPEWFGRPDATARYIAEADKLTMLAAFKNGLAIGFLTLRAVDDTTVDIHVLGVLRTHHRRGVGRQLINAAMEDCRRRGATKLQVQTLGSSVPDRNYAATRAFYDAVGFSPLREDTWPDGTPRLILAQPVR
jgi:GNAT superfamily N-acetyltransferase